MRTLSNLRGSSRNRTYRGPVYSQPCHLDSSTAVVVRFNSAGNHADPSMGVTGFYWP